MTLGPTYRNDFARPPRYSSENFDRFRERAEDAYAAANAERWAQEDADRAAASESTIPPVSA